jgi:cytochrome c553
VIAQLFLMRDGRRTKRPTPMDPFAKGLSDDDLRAYGELFSRQPAPAQPAGAVDATRYAKGRALAEKHNCASCHGADYSGQPQVPRLAHQREEYLIQALRDYKKGERSGYGSAAMPEALGPLGRCGLRAARLLSGEFPSQATMIDHIDHIVLTTRDREAAFASTPKCSA